MSPLFSPEKLSNAGFEPDTIEKVTLAYQAVRRLIDSDVPLAVACSFGKDSTAALILTLLAHHDAVRENPYRHPLAILTADTQIDNPVVAAHVHGQIAKLEDYARRHNLPLEVRIGRPTLAASWIVSVLGMRKIPTFANSASRDCAIELKRRPNVRSLRKLIPELCASYEERLRSADPEEFFQLSRLASSLEKESVVTVVGTRFDESAVRARKMAARGDVVREITTTDEGNRTLPLIADLSADEVWEILALAGEGRTLEAYAPDFEDTKTLYREATGECPVVASMKERTAPCQSRFGCSLCTVSGSTDKSMEVMLTNPKHEFMRPLNALRNFLVATQYAIDRRRWTARTTDPVTGHVRIGPDVYSPAMVEELLGICLTIDARERERADALNADLRVYHSHGRVSWSDAYLRETAAKGAPDIAWAEAMSKPQFHLVSPEALIAIDFMWARYGAHRPFHALHIWREVVERGVRYEIPTVDAPQDRHTLRMPEPRWISLPPNTRLLHPLFDPLTSLYYERPGRDLPAVTEKTCVEYQQEETFSVDPEACWAVLEFEADHLLAQYHDGPFAPCTAVMFYLRFGAVALASGRLEELAQTVNHSQRLQDAGLGPGTSIEDLLARSISDKEHAALRSGTAKEEQRRPMPQAGLGQGDLFASLIQAA